jgi:hypothetical protein
VTRVVADLVMANFFLDRVFSTGGDVQGGAVLYDQANYLDIYTDRDVERVEPGTEAPIVTGQRTAPLVALVEKFGGKFPMTDEARRRNDISRMNNHMRRLANTIVRTFTAAQRESENNEFGYSYDTMIVNPTEAESFRTVYADTVDAVLRDNGITTMISTPRKAAGSAYLLAGGQVGEMRLEEPLRTVIEREGAPTLREQTWTQSMVNPVFFVTDPYAIIEMTGIA